MIACFVDIGGIDNHYSFNLDNIGMVSFYTRLILRGSAEQSPCFEPTTNKSHTKRHHTNIVFIVQYYILFSLFSI